jgi:outer membrane protein assembly factor BamE (lipoprotein component of BamABCDE complex)
MKLRSVSALFLVIVTITLSACGTAIINKNLNNIKLLRKGMDKTEVLAVMGDPLKNEVYNTENVWYYFTSPKWSDGVITRDECTPLFFQDGKLEGWGQTEYKKYRQRNW